MDQLNVKEFSIYPSYQLLEKASEEYFYVENVEEETDITTLRNIIENLSQYPESIGTNENFDHFYSAIRGFHEFDPKDQKKIIQSLCQCVDKLIESCTETLGEVKSTKENADSQKVEIGQYRNSLKMYVFLLYHYSSSYDVKGKKKDKTFKKVKVWRELLLKTFHSLFEQSPKKLDRLWPTNRPEDEYFLLFFNLSNSYMADERLMKYESCRTYVFDIFKMFFTERNQPEGEVEELVKSIVNKKHVGKLIVQYIETRKPEETFLSQLLLEIGQYDTKNLEKNTIKNFSSVLVDLSKTIPEQVVKNMSVIVVHLQDKWYQIRNAVIMCLTELLSNYFKANPSKKQVRDRFLEIFEERLKDVNAYTRNKTIQCLTELYIKQSLPNYYRLTIFPQIIERMKDKSSTVRKSAISFVTSALNHNPYGGILKLSRFEKDLVDSRNKLRDYEVENRIHRTEEKDLAGEDDEDEDGDNKEEEEGKEATDKSSKITNIIAQGEEGFVGGESSLNTIYIKLQKVYRYYADATKFILDVHKSLEEVEILLNSSNINDLKESIRLIVCCHDYQIEDSLKHVGRIIPLVWSSEDISEHVIEAFREIFFKKKMVNAEVCLETAEYLIKFISQAKIVELQAMTTIIIDLIHSKVISTPLILAFWENYIPSGEMKKRNVSERIAAAIFLQMVAQAKPKAIVQRFGQIINGVLNNNCNIFLAIHTCRMLYHVRKLKGVPNEADVKFLEKGYVEEEDDKEQHSSGEEDSSSSEEEEDHEGDVRMKKGKKMKKKKEEKIYNRPLKAGKDYLVLPSDHAIFETLLQFLTERSFPISPWCSYGKELVRVIFSLSYQPKAIMNFIFDVLREKVEVLEITKVIFLLGESCMRELELVISQKRDELTVLKKQSKKRIEEGKKAKQNLEEIKRSNEKLVNDLEDLYYQKQEEIINTDSIYLLYYNFILDIVADKNRRFGNSLFRKVALHTLGRYMTVNRLLCQKNLMVIFELVLREENNERIEKLKKQKKKKKKKKKKKNDDDDDDDEDDDDDDEEDSREESKDENKMEDEKKSEDEDENKEEKKQEEAKEEEEEEKKESKNEPMVDEEEEIESEEPKQQQEQQQDQEEQQKETKEQQHKVVDEEEEEGFVPSSLCLSKEIRCNLILQIGDLFYRWTSELTKWKNEFYQLLNSKEEEIRHNTLIILSNLILNDMVKSSSQMGQIARLIVDPNQRIGLRAKVFFRELAKKKIGKTNPVYNLLPDIFSHLSVLKGLKRNEFQEIMSYLFQYIRLESQRIQLVKRFCERFKRTTDETVWKYLSFCLLELRIQKDKIFKVVINSWKHYKNALSCDEVCEDLLKVSTIVRKNTKDELFKNEISEWEEKAKKQHRKLSGKNENEKIGGEDEEDSEDEEETETEKKDEKAVKEKKKKRDKMVDEEKEKKKGKQKKKKKKKKKKEKEKEKKEMVDEEKGGEESEEIESEGEESDSDFDIDQHHKEEENKKKKENEEQRLGEESEDEIVFDEEEQEEEGKKMVDEEQVNEISESESESEEQMDLEDE